MTTTSAREGMGGEMGIDAMADEALQEAYNHGCAHMAACTGAGTREAEMEHEAHAADARAALLAELARVEAERDAAVAVCAATLGTDPEIAADAGLVATVEALAGWARILAADAIATKATP